MRNNNVFKRLLSVFLVLCLVFAAVIPSNVSAAGIKFTQVSNDRVSADVLGKDPAQLNGNQQKYDATDVVRVSIFLDKAGVIDAGYSVDGLAQNDKAMAYRDKLAKEQKSVVNKIEKATEEKLDVVWNLTLATNLISANVKYGQIEAISRIRGVRNVVVETQYEPDVVSSGAADPNMATSGAQIGIAGSYVAGYTGAGSRIAIIDTGLDINHQSFDSSAYTYSLGNLADKAGVSAEEYIASLNLLDAEEISAVLGDLNVLSRLDVSADDMYFNEKIPFIFNYIDGNTNVTHLYDQQGEHGSHVTGIAAANAYIPNGDGTFSNAMDTVHVQGVAPDAQVLVMKVFGENGGAYPADYMAAIEDAILLGADSVNLSLGGGNPGMATDTNAEFQAIFNSLEKSGVVVSISAGNSGGWPDAAENGIPYMYLDDVGIHTGGSPGSYTNSLGVASVDNAGYVTGYLPQVTVNGTNVIYYETTDYGNAPFATLAGEHEYVFLNGIGTPEQFAALGEGALTGKIALCYRGETSFFEKANAAVEAGAIGVMIVNNQVGIIGLNLTGYLYTAPVVSLTMVDGEYFKTNPVTDADGNVMCWTGTMSMPEAGKVEMYDTPYYTMSSFSSWGVPGSLTMKPEITAPGGNILSVNGANAAYGVYDHESYELMSGTSMAAPQVTGMAALVEQYIRENNLTEKTGLDARTLAQSLLMSTAVPMGDGNNGGYYYPVLQQGAGLANVGAAIMADSYIMMNADATESYADGKVKVELGDDPNKTGSYTFSFTINNLTDSEKTYALSADFFTQGAFAYGSELYMDTWTTGLSPMVVFTVNGKEIEGGAAMFGMDFNGDGYVNSADGQALLDYTVGVVSSISNAANADLDGNGKIGSYDAYLFFQMLGECGAVVAANGSATVEVTVTLSDSDKEWLANYENGAYLEGYVYAESIVDAEGVEGTCHSIPVLGFYGNWSDPSMFDKLSYEDLLSGQARVPYLYQSCFASGLVNSLYITYGDGSGEYNFGGNPLVMDAIYMPERNAISAVNGDTISTIGFTSIRNAAASFYQVLDLTNGQVLENQGVGAVSSAYYYVNGGYWNNTYWELNTNADFSGIADGTQLEVGITLIPEYFVDEEGNVAWESLGDGTTFSMGMTVDNTAPTLNDVSMSMFSDTMTVKATDNQYVAAVVLLDSFGEHIYTMTGSNLEAIPNETYEYTLDLTDVNGASFLLQVYDYAMNCTTYEIDTQIGEVVDTVEGIEISEDSLVMQKGSTEKLSATVLPVNATNREIIWSSSNEAVATVAEDGTVLAVDEGTAQIVATSALDPAMTATCYVEVIDVAVDMNAIIWDEVGSIWFSQFNTANLPEYTKLSGDMLNTDYLAAACVGPDGTIYASSLNTNAYSGYFYHIDPNTYEATLISDCGGYFYSDMAYAPNLYGPGVDALLVTYGFYVISVDPATGAWIEIIDQYDVPLVGITVCYGYYYEDYGQSDVTVYVAQADGTLVQESYVFAPDLIGYTIPYYYYMYGFRMGMDTGIDKSSAIWFNSLHYDAENAMVFWSAFEQNVDNSVTLYAIDEMNDFAIYNLGQFGEGVWPVAGLYQSTVTTDDAEPAQRCCDLKELLANKDIEHKDIKIETIEVVKEKLTSSATLPAMPMGGVTVGEGEDTITVDITAKDATGANVATTNGVVTVTFDATALVLKNVVVNGDYRATVKADGSVTFGYVNLAGFNPDDVVATLVFDVLNTEATDVAVTFQEMNQDEPNTETDMEVTFPHTNTTVEGYKAPTCTEDGYSGDTVCTDCGKVVSEGEVLPATGHEFGDWTETKAPTCTEDGEESHTCHCGETETRPIAATGHKYNAVVTAPTTDAEGYTTHTCEHCGDSYVDSYTDKLPAVNPDNSQTGDEFAPVLIVGLLGSVTALAVLVLMRKKYFL